jgi:2-C-methyl-D-erythritol 4-phosphate cytidylyltransferase
MNYGIVVAAGKSERMGVDVDKAFLSLGTQPVLVYSLVAFEKCQDIDGVILVVRKDRVEAARAMVSIFGCFKVKKIIAGGATRQMSVQNGLSQLSDEVSVVVVHDGARPLVTSSLISESIKGAKKNGSAVAAVKVTDTVKHVESGFVVSKTVDRTKLWSVQTPQAFKKEILLKAFETVKKKHLTVTDEASAVELVTKVHLIPAPVSNLKITTADDLALAAALLKL